MAEIQIYKRPGEKLRAKIDCKDTLTLSTPDDEITIEKLTTEDLLDLNSVIVELLEEVL